MKPTDKKHRIEHLKNKVKKFKIYLKKDLPEENKNDLTEKVQKSKKLIEILERQILENE